MQLGIQELGIQEYGVRKDTSTFSSIKQEFIQMRERILERSNNMIRNNIRNLVIGFTVGSLGLALAVAIPNAFTNGTVISSSAVNANFTEMKKAIDALEAKQAFGFEFTVPAGTIDQFILDNPKLNGDPNWIVTLTLNYKGQGYEDVDKGFGVYYVQPGLLNANKWVVNYFKVGQNLSGRKFFVTAIRP
jgi:hypothetical protein